MIRIREAAVAGSFYPADATELREMVQRMLDASAGPAALGAPQALVVPHAGYVYSGPVAAAAYALLYRQRRRYRRVLLLGPSHQVPLSGMALSSADGFRTPLGVVPLDRPLIAALGATLGNVPRHPAVGVLDAAHRSEHSLEVQLPFLQVALDEFSLVPVVVGDVEPEAVAEVIECFWTGPETLPIVSSDLSHYLAYAQAQRRDRDTCRAIEALDAAGVDHAGACGATPLRGLLLAAARRGLRAVTLDLRNSGDTAGGPATGMDRVVGYGAWMFVEDEPCLAAA